MISNAEKTNLQLCKSHFFNKIGKKRRHSQKLWGGFSTKYTGKRKRQYVDLFFSIT